MGYTYVPDVLKVRMSEGDQAKGLDCKPENDREGGCHGTRASSGQAYYDPAKEGRNTERYSNMSAPDHHGRRIGVWASA